MSPKSKKITAIIACYKDAQAMPIMYKRLVKVFKKIKVEYEIIFVNDNSPDNAQEVLEKLAKKDKRLVVVKHTRNFGSQACFTSGMKIASGDAIVLLDGDLQDPPEIIEKFYYKWLKGYDVVFGRRVKREATAFLQFTYKAFYRVFKKTSYINIPRDAGDFSLMDREVVEAINSLPETNRFMRGLRAWVGFKQTGVNYVRPERMFGVTTNSPLKNIDWARKAIFSFSYMPLEIITWLGIGTVALSGIGIVVFILAKLFFPDRAPLGFATMAVMILFIGGVQMICLSILGTYLSHIYDEVKKRPTYIVEKVINKPSRSL